MKIETIQVNISGKVGVGKSAILQSIKSMLEECNYCVAVPDREEKHNPSNTLKNAAPHEKPKYDTTVIVLTESLI